MDPVTAPKFHDLAGNEFTIRLSFATVRAIRDATEIDFGEPEKFPQYWAELLASDALALKVLCVAIGDNYPDGYCLEENVDGPTLESGLNALAEAVVLFTRPQKRGLVIEARDKINEYWQKAVDESRAAIVNFSDERMSQALAQLTSSPPNVPA